MFLASAALSPFSMRSANRLNSTRMESTIDVQFQSLIPGPELSDAMSCRSLLEPKSANSIQLTDSINAARGCGTLTWRALRHNLLERFDHCGLKNRIHAWF